MKTTTLFLVSLFFLLLSTNNYSQQPVMVKDIYSGSNTSFSYNPSFTKINSTLFFAANDGVNGFELWKSDGTNAGTVMVKDINLSSSGTSYGSEPRNLTNVNGTLLFTANNGINGRELWKSDGTEAGTVMIKDLNPSLTDNTGFIDELINFNGTLFFSANANDNGTELWKSDGTDAGTVMVIDINPGFTFDVPNRSNPNNFINVNGALFFAAYNEINGNELWKSDGTASGTVMVSNTPGTASTVGSYPNLTIANGILFFSGESIFFGTELWKSDGSTAGTAMVKDIYPGYTPNGVAYSSGAGSFANVNGILFFIATDIDNNLELWKSDGTVAGTIKVKEIRESTFNFGSNPTNLTNVNGILYFSANDGIHGIEMWKSDGTEAGTTLVKDINAGISSSEPGQFTNINGTIYFVAGDNIIGQELFKTDGTASGTIGYNIRFLSESSSPEGLINVADNLFFNATNGGQNGRELWRLNTNSLSTLKNITNDSKFLIFPNPVKNILTITNPENTSIDKISITDITGKKVLEQNDGTNTLNLENLQNGMYLLQVISNGKNTISKFIKN
ncbi:T9SS type A sorting domain-containing protein [Flavobacterium franklandianum]|uniref:T9SS type A sorting domain-containing protein n=1 Tax=Flavobacterium franklandianum TaxID=2594430 RepID=A0A553CMA7_9FLAO|nr:ELWxxDGT repeat protein [Flavobacterium franklandianum]TRX21619.1 T9SS type A sorting domain-containing protein [Flavobacterium franklandianum]TRX25224.1 T9SS type A sorting domain-containing protein [Flavobacterium franklandianum]